MPSLISAFSNHCLFYFFFLKKKKHERREIRISYHFLKTYFLIAHFPPNKPLLGGQASVVLRQLAYAMLSQVRVVSLLLDLLDQRLEVGNDVVQVVGLCFGRNV